MYVLVALRSITLKANVQFFFFMKLLGKPKTHLMQNDEAGKIEAVVVHRPGLETLVAVNDPENWLYDPALKSSKVSPWDWLQQAQKEHDKYASRISKLGANVVYLNGLLSARQNYLVQKLIEKANLALDLKLVSRKSHESFMEDIHADPVTAAFVGIGASMDQYRRMHQQGLNLLVPKPNAYFAQDTVIPFGDHIIIPKMAVWQREGEAELVAIAFKDYDKIIYMGHPIEGGDVTIHAGDAYIANGTRTNLKAIAQIAARLDRVKGINDLITVGTPYTVEKGVPFGSSQGYVVQTTKGPVEVQIHGDVAFTFPLQNTVLGNEGLMAEFTATNGHGPVPLLEHLAIYRLIKVDESEQSSYPSNVLPLNGSILSLHANSGTNAKIKAADVPVIAISLPRLAEGSGGPHCMAAAFNTFNYK